MKIAVIGSGKTGGKVIELLEPEQLIGPFSSRNKPDANKLTGADVVIAFVPGSAVLEVAEIVFAARLPFVCGATGFYWDEEWNSRLKAVDLSWIVGANFSLGMSVCKELLGIVGGATSLFDSSALSIHEVHHTDKKDAPSGTALQWKKWVGGESEITYERTGDVCGVHELKLFVQGEEITVRHQSHDRSIYAQGALWAAEQLGEGALSSGLHQFDQISTRLLQEKISGQNDQSSSVGGIGYAIC